MENINYAHHIIHPIGLINISLSEKSQLCYIININEQYHSLKYWVVLITKLCHKACLKECLLGHINNFKF